MNISNILNHLAASQDTLINGLVAFGGAIITGTILYCFYLVFSSNLFEKSITTLLHKIDSILTKRIAPLTGVTLKTRLRRWLALSGAMLAVSIVAALAPFKIAFGSILLGIIFVLAIYRAWEADEKARRLKEDMNETVDVSNDLGNEVLFGLVFLVIFFTLGFSRLSEVSRIYEGVPNVPIAQSAVFVWGEFLKAVPFVDASEVYGWSNVSGLKASGGAGRTMTFVLRVFLDLILLTAILKTLSIVRRRAEGADLRDIRRMLASDDEETILSGIDALADLSMRNRLNAQRELERIALKEIETVPKLAEPQYLVAVADHLHSLTIKFGSQRFVLVAIVAYRSALQACTREFAPSIWAAIQNQLGKALLALGEISGDTAELEDAVAAFRVLLEVRTREAVPYDWAMTQHNLGGALLALGNVAGDTALLEDAVTACNAALEVYTPEAVPHDWAMTQNMLGAALRELGEISGDTARLEDAVAAFRVALEVYTREVMPPEWAMTESNLGATLKVLGEISGDTALLEDAVTAHRAALEVRTRQAMPSGWAATQNNLGNALSTLGEISGDTNAAQLEDAASAYRAALEVYTREAMPSDWAATQNNLGAALAGLGEIAGDAAQLEDAASAHRATLEVYTREAMPSAWAATQANLGVALAGLGRTAGDAAQLEDAASAFRAALEVRTCEAMPSDWATTQNNLGAALADLGRIAGDVGPLENALTLWIETKPFYRDAGQQPLVEILDEAIGEVELLIQEIKDEGTR